MARLYASGYVHRMLDNNMDFSKFVWECARGVGALVMMRDDPPNTPIPERFEPSDYHSKALAEAQATIERLTPMTTDEKLAFGEIEKKTAIDMWLEAAEEEAAEIKRVKAMFIEVQKWAAPSPDHEEFKKFMLQQLKQSMPGSGDGTHRELLDEARAKDAMTYYSEALQKAHDDIEYHKEEHAEEVGRTERRNLWIKQLRESVPTG